MAIRSIATAGMISDTSLYNVDGACVVGGAAAIPVGTVVGVTSAQPVDGHKVVAATGVTAANVLGVVVRSHYETPDGTAKPQGAVNVLTHGRIWALTSLEAAPVFASAVSVSATGTVVAADTEGAALTGWTFAGGFVAAANGNPALVEIQIKQK